METAGHPATYADWLGAPGKPTLLFYGHFDVQPVDPLSLWTTPPFEPEIRDGRIYARGASDIRVEVLSLIQAIEGVLQGEGKLPVNIKLLFEGEEEIGGANLRAVLAERKAQLACDHIISVDGGQWSETVGGILVSLKGMCGDRDRCLRRCDRPALRHLWRGRREPAGRPHPHPGRDARPGRQGAGRWLLRRCDAAHGRGARGDGGGAL